MPNSNQSEAQTTIKFLPECQAVMDIASHQTLFGALLDSVDHRASEPKGAELKVESSAFKNPIAQLPVERNLPTKTNQLITTAICQRLAELEMHLMIGFEEVLEIPLEAK